MFQCYSNFKNFNKTPKITIFPIRIIFFSSGEVTVVSTSDLRRNSNTYSAQVHHSKQSINSVKNEHSGLNQNVFRKVPWLADFEKNVTITRISRNSVTQYSSDIITSHCDYQSINQPSDSSSNLLFNSSFNQPSSQSITQSIKRRITQSINQYQETVQSKNHQGNFHFYQKLAQSKFEGFMLY